MIPSCVSMSCDANPFYLDFWEPVSRIWSKMGIHPYLFYVGDVSHKPSNAHGTVVHVSPVDGVPINTQAQWARFHFTQTNLDAVWITSDIDMFPLSRKHFVDSVLGVKDDCWLATNSSGNYFPVCYNYAKGSLFQEVLDLADTFEKSLERMRWWENTSSHIVDGVLMKNWSADEVYSSHKIVQFRNNNHHRVIQRYRSDPRRRVDRSAWGYDPYLVSTEAYFDCHSIRPYHQHKEEIERLLSLIKV